MKKCVYVAGVHDLVKVMSEGEIIFPISKQDMISKAGSLKVRTDFDTYTPLSKIIQDIEIEYFDCAAAFYNALTASTWTNWIKKNNYRY